MYFFELSARVVRDGANVRCASASAKRLTRDDTRRARKNVKHAIRGGECERRLCALAYVSSCAAGRRAAA